MKYLLGWVCAFLSGAASTTGRALPKYRSTVKQSRDFSQRGLGRAAGERIGENMNMNKDHTLGFFIGFSVGVGMALLLAPKSGAKTRSMIAKTAKEGSDYLKQQVSDLSGTTADLIGKASKEAVRAAESLGDAAGAGKQHLKESGV